MPKTGSTAIQKTLQGYDDGKIRYLNIGPSNHSTFTQTLFLPAEILMRDFPTRVPDEISANSQRKFLTQRIEAELAIGRPEYILSSEHVYHLSESAFLDNLVPFLEERFDEIEAICYIRPPKSFIQSAFQQKVKTGLVDFKLENPNYERKLSKLFRTGWRLNFRQYRNTDVVVDFANAIGIRKDAGQSHGENTSLTAFATALLFSFNRTGHLPESLEHLREDRAALIQRIAKIGPQESLSIDESVMSINHKDLDWVLKRIGIDLSEQSAQGVNCAQDILDLAADAESLLKNQTHAHPDSP